MNNVKIQEQTKQKQNVNNYCDKLFPLIDCSFIVFFMISRSKKVKLFYFWIKAQIKEITKIHYYLIVSCYWPISMKVTDKH